MNESESGVSHWRYVNCETVDTNINTGKSVYGEDLFHRVTICIMKSFGQCVYGVWLERKWGICGASAQDGQAKLAKVVGRRHFRV